MRFGKKNAAPNGNHVETIPAGNEQPIAIVEPSDDPPDGGYGWVVCYALGQLNGFTWGVAAVREIGRKLLLALS
jgi:hypothetical protein